MVYESSQPREQYRNTKRLTADETKRRQPIYLSESDVNDDAAPQHWRNQRLICQGGW